MLIFIEKPVACYKFCFVFCFTDIKGENLVREIGAIAGQQRAEILDEMRGIAVRLNNCSIVPSLVRCNSFIIPAPNRVGAIYRNHFVTTRSSHPILRY